MVKNSKSTKNASIRALASAIGKAKQPARKAVKSGPVKVKPRKPSGTRGGFGPVATIDTAPVSIGNSISGSPAIVVPTADGVRVKGRDFLFNVDATATSITGWTLVGGAPISPVCMVSSAVKGFVSSYAHYCIHGVSFHFITSSATSDVGSLTMYINKSRQAPGIPTDGNSFLPTILSDHNTVLAPLWKNSSAVYIPEPCWLPTEIFSDEDLHEQAVGEILLYTRTASNAITGYLLVDFDISFRHMQANPKNLLLPIARMKYTQMAFTLTGANITALNGAIFNVTTGTLMDGTTTSALPTSATVGDVYKVIFNTNDATLTTATLANLITYGMQNNSILSPITLTDGFTCYAVLLNATQMALYPNFIEAMTGSGGQYLWQTTQVVTVKFPMYVSLVGSIFGVLRQSNI